MALTAQEEALATQLKDELQNGDKRTNDISTAVIDGVECVGDVVVTFQHVFLKALYNKNPADFGNLSTGSIALTGFKLESTFLDSEQLISNSKIIPLLNGDTITLVNACRAGSLTIGCTRTAAGINGGDMIAIFDFIRSQGDAYGGKLTITWTVGTSLAAASITRSITFDKVTVAKIIPVRLAGNDLPDYQAVLNFARPHDSDAMVV